MPTNYPNALDALLNPSPSDPLNAPGHASQHSNVNDAIEAIEAYLGTVGSLNTQTITYQMSQRSLISHNHDSQYANIVHTHTIAQVSGLAAALDSKVDDIEVQFFVTTNTDQIVGGLKSFGILPQSTVVPATDAEFTNKGYVDRALLSAGASINAMYTWDDLVSMTDPGAGKMRSNNANLDSVTQFSISRTDSNGQFYSFTAVGVGDILILGDTSRANTYGRYGISAIQIFTTYALISVIVTGGSSGNPGPADVMDIIWVPDSGSSGAGAIQADMTFSTSTTAADPGTGYLRYNNATPESVTALYVDETTSTGASLDLSMVKFAIGDTVDISNAVNPGNYMRYQATGTAVDNGGWWTLPVSFMVIAGAAFTNNLALKAKGSFASAGGVPEAPNDGLDYWRNNSIWAVANWNTLDGKPNVLTDSNYTTYTVTKDGTGATGTWGISIAGTSSGCPWSGVTGRPNTLAGYGIGDAYTKTESDTLYPKKDGTGATGSWNINITGSAASAGSVTNGVYTTGNQTIGGIKTFSSPIAGSLNGNANSATVSSTVDDANSTSNLLFWSGTQAQYNAVSPKNANTIYFVTA